ncbi:coiled-coil domain-containing protein 50 isoform X2 [Girardinichthys multiradiatus]|uniref:coiled-coil domain-containing protein 50 isoform X2 n=1 Tax=Girardinichthys multiradiatus TaxID=208333 RepID=UPI001FADDA74|nr:coiled-coil domain-containing protein 50 isoform X2 [Girardinichthys multiradiatus]
MAECNVSIDQKKLPGVKEVCKDFAVLEDHSLAYNLQEQEIESHLASNVHKNRLVQKDLQVAKKLQEEEDKRAKIQSQKKNIDIERQDIEIAQEIQEQLVRQAEQQRWQEEKDAAIARKLHEKEMKEERRRHKGKYEEDYFEDHGASRTADVDGHARQKSRSPDRYGSHSPLRSNQNYSPDYYSVDNKRSRYPKQDSAAPHSHSRYPEDYLEEERGHSKHADMYPEHLLPSRGKHGDRYPEFEPSYSGKTRDQGLMDVDSVIKRKEKPARPPPPNIIVERDKDRYRHDGDKDYKTERHVEKEHTRNREQDLRQRREREKSRDRIPSDEGQRERDRHRQKDRRQARSMEGGLNLDFLEPGSSRIRPGENRGSWEKEEDDGGRRARSQPRIHSLPVEVFDEFMNGEARGDTREIQDLQLGDAFGREHTPSRPSRETGHVVHKGSGSPIAETEYGLTEVTKGLTNLDLREQELKDLEVARRLQEEELKQASNMQERAAQMAKDEEIARLLMEKEKKEYRRNREREKEKERERLAMEKIAMERKRHEGNYKSSSEEVVRPRTQDEYDYHRQRNNNNRPARPPQPRTHDYENVSSVYGYSDHPAASRPPQRPEAAYRGTLP